MTSKRTARMDATTRARQIAEKARPKMRVVELAPMSDELHAAADAVVPESEHGLKAAATNSSKELHMVTMESKTATDARVPRKSLTIIVDDEKVVGEQG